MKMKPTEIRVWCKSTVGSNYKALKSGSARSDVINVYKSSVKIQSTKECYLRFAQKRNQNEGKKYITLINVTATSNTHLFVAPILTQLLILHITSCLGLKENEQEAIK